MTDSFKNNILIILSVMIFGLSYGLSTPLISLELMKSGYGEIYIGINASLHAVGELIAAPIIPLLYLRYSTKKLLIISLLAVSILLFCIPLVPIKLWIIFRLFLGFFSGFILVISEAWVNHNSMDNNRTRIMAFYITSLSIGFALGPLILSIVGSNALIAFITGGFVTMIIIIFLSFSKNNILNSEKEAITSYRSYLSVIPVAIFASFLNSVLDSFGMSMLVIYAMNLGWVEQQATLLLFTLLCGAISMQIPIGLLADKINKQYLVIILSALSALGAFLWPVALQLPIAAYLLLFIWGGVFCGIYTVMVSVIGMQFKGTQLAIVYSILSIAWAIGALIGPLFGGVAMRFYLHGIPITTGLLCLFFMFFSIYRKKDFYKLRIKNEK